MTTIRSKPDFIIAGVQKGGTTSLFNYLAQHPQVATSSVKEVHYFDVNYLAGMEWYLQCFPLEIECVGKVVGEASPYYIFHPLSAQRIKKDLPDAKIIILLRNPIARAYSNFQMQLRHKNEKETTIFEEGIAKEDARMEGEVEKILNDESYNSYNHRKLSYKSRGLYYQQVKHWLDIFGREKILILKSEDFFAQTMGELKKVYKFLGINYFEPPNLEPSNKHEYQPISSDAIEELKKYYKEDGEKLVQLLGANFKWW